MVELSQNELRVLQSLAESGGPATIGELAQRPRLADSAVARAVLNLSENELVREQVERKTELTLTKEGQSFANDGLPERRIVSVVMKNGGRIALGDALRQAALDEKYASIVTGWISRKHWGKIEKTESDLQIAVEAEPARDEDEDVLARLKIANAILEELPSNLRGTVQRLVKRNLVEARAKNDRTIEITAAGQEAAASSESSQEVNSLTGEMIASGDWEKIKLRSYNVSSQVPPTFPGKYHPYLRFLRMVKRKLVALGFKETVGPLVETAFINCDCLYMPQDHPAREIHDLYYLKEPSSASLERYGDLVERVAETHENGWKTG